MEALFVGMQGLCPVASFSFPSSMGGFTREVEIGVTHTGVAMEGLMGGSKDSFESSIFVCKKLCEVSA